MLKIVIIFMLLTFIGSPMNTTSMDNNTSKNITLNNSSTNDTHLSDLGIDASLLNWFTKPTKSNAPLSLSLALDDIKLDYLNSAIETYGTGRLMTEEDFSRRSIPPVVKKKPEIYIPGDIPDHEFINIIDPDLDLEPIEGDPWLITPPWEDEPWPSWESEEPAKGCSELICDENGICHVICYD